VIDASVLLALRGRIAVRAQLNALRPSPVGQEA